MESCDYKWTNLNGVKGGLFTSKINGNSIFLPAAGDCFDLMVCGRGFDGYYWSSSAYGRYSAYSIDFYVGRVCMSESMRSNGYSVRLVK